MNTVNSIILLLILIICYCFWSKCEGFPTSLSIADWFYDPSTKAENYHKGISGYSNDENARNMILETKKIDIPESIEKFRMGEVLLNNIHDIPETRNEYVDTLNTIVNRPLEGHNLFILDRIETDYLTNPGLITYDNAIGDNVLNYIPEIRNHVTSNRITNHPPRNTKERKVEALADKQEWTRDMQSVHDSSISQSMRDSFHNIKNYNAAEYGPLSHSAVDRSMKNLKETFNTLSGGNTQSGGGYRKVLQTSSAGLKVHDVGTESEVIVEIWRRINSADNAQNKNDMQQSLYESMNDCVENGSLVCTQGRVTRMLQSMAHMDNDSTIGVMKSTESIRNEAYKNAASILNRNIEVLSEKNQKLYNSNKRNNTITTMETVSKQEITKMIDGLTDLNDNQRRNLIEECVAVV